jgi:hypothetical protein
LLVELKKLNPTETKDTAYNATLRDSLPIVQLAWRTLQLLVDRRKFYDPKEADWRLPIDVLIQHVFGEPDDEYRTSVLYVSFSSIAPLVLMRHE